MPVNNPDRAFFWDATNKSWRAAQVGDPGEYVWNDTTKSWEFGDIGAEYKWNRTTRAWEPGPGGQYVYNRSTKSWDKVTSPGYGGPFYWDTSSNSWVKNTDAAQVSDAFARWDFINNQAWWDGAYVGGVSSTPNWTFTRASTAYYRNSSGLLTSVASGVLRTGDRGALIEGAGTNLCLQSQTFDNASWSKVATTVSADATAAPDGTTTADRLYASGGSGQHYAQQSISFTSGTVYTLSYYAKAAELSFVQLTLGSAAFSTTPYCNFNLATGAAGTPSNCTATSTALANGWYRCTITATATATASAGVVALPVTAISDGRLPTYSSDGNGIYLWGAQLEATAYASSYIPTTTASATRAADSLTVTGVSGLGADLSGYHRIRRSADKGAVESYFQIDDGTDDNRIRIAVDASDRAELLVVAGGVTQAQIAVTGAMAVDTAYNIAWRVTEDSAQICRSGTLGTEDTSVTVPTGLTTIRFGSGVSGANPCVGYRERDALWMRALSDAELQAQAA